MLRISQSGINKKGFSAWCSFVGETLDHFEAAAVHRVESIVVIRLEKRSSFHGLLRSWCYTPLLIGLSHSEFTQFILDLLRRSDIIEYPPLFPGHQTSFIPEPALLACTK